MAAAVLAARRSWAGVDPDAISESWAARSLALGAVLTRLQGMAARDGAAMVPRVLDELGTPVDPIGELNPSAVAGFAGSGWDPVTVFESAPIAAKHAIAGGASPADALVAGGGVLSGIVLTAMADAGRQGAALGVLTRPRVGYTRMLNPPSCSRCAILAGRPSRREAFRRHPRCDCRAIPTMETQGDQFTVDTSAYFGGLDAAEQDRIFTKAGAQAIRDGADINQVVNARRGMSAMQSPGSFKWLVTNEGTTRRGLGFKAMDQAGWTRAASKDNASRRALTRQRLMPETIYAIARNQDDALQLLKAYGYVL